MKKTFKENAKRNILILSIIILISAMIIGIYLINSLPVSEKADIGKSDELPVIRQEEKEQTYITETSYDGSQELNPVLFSFPFQKTGDYIKNKELVKIISEEKIEGIQNRASDFVLEFYNVNGKTLTKDYKAVEEKAASYMLQDSFYIDEVENIKSADTYLSDYLKLLSDAGFQAEVTFQTDKSLVFEDLQYYVRGLLTMTVFEYNSEYSMSEYIPIQLQKGKTYVAVVDIGLVPETSRLSNTYKISKIDFLFWQEQKQEEEALHTNYEADALIIK